MKEIIEIFKDDDKYYGVFSLLCKIIKKSKKDKTPFQRIYKTNNKIIATDSIRMLIVDVKNCDYLSDKCDGYYRVIRSRGESLFLVHEDISEKYVPYREIEKKKYHQTFNHVFRNFFDKKVECSIIMSKIKKCIHYEFILDLIIKIRGIDVRAYESKKDNDPILIKQKCKWFSLCYYIMDIKHS